MTDYVKVTVRFRDLPELNELAGELRQVEYDETDGAVRLSAEDQDIVGRAWVFLGEYDLYNPLEETSSDRPPIGYRIVVEVGTVQELHSVLEGLDGYNLLDNVTELKEVN